jgi:hypothetical protein
MHFEKEVGKSVANCNNFMAFARKVGTFLANTIRFIYNQGVIATVKPLT